MNTCKKYLAAAVSTLAVPTLAVAHGSGSEASTLYHYMSSPDHVITFCLLALAVAGFGLGFTACAVKARRIAVNATQRHKR